MTKGLPSVINKRERGKRMANNTKKKIEKLTPEQEARIPEFVEKWLKVGLSVETLSYSETRPIIDAFYAEILGKAVPEFVVIMDSPLSAWFAVC